MGQPVVHWEFWSEDPDRVSEFYRTVFDWDIQHVPDLNYHMVDTKADSGIKGGIMKPAGGKMLMDNMEVPGVGHLSLFEDPDGRVLGMWKRA